MLYEDLYFTTSWGKSIHAVRKGTGKVYLFLVHGLLNNWESWQEIANLDTENKFTFIAIELLGYGQSDRQGRYSLDNCADQVIEFISDYIASNHIDSDGNVFVGGLSMGSVVTACVASKQCPLIDGYILMGPVFRDYKKRLSKRLMRYVIKLSRLTPATAKLMEFFVKTRFMSYSLALFNMYKFNKALIDKYGVEGKQQVDIKAYGDLCIEISRFDTLTRLMNRLDNVSLLMIMGKYDPYASVNMVADGSLFKGKDFGRYEVELVDKAGHPVSYENPTGTFNAIKRFVSAKLDFRP